MRKILNNLFKNKLPIALFSIVVLCSSYLYRHYSRSNLILVKPSVSSASINGLLVDDQHEKYILDNDRENAVTVSPNNQKELVLDLTFSPVLIDQIGFDFANKIISAHELTVFDNNVAVYHEKHSEDRLTVDKFVLPSKLKADRIELKIPQIGEPIDILEVLFWQTSNSPISKIIFIPRSFAGYLVLITIGLATVFLSGTYVLKLLRINNQDLALIYSLGITFIFTVSLFRQFFSFDFIYLLIPISIVQSLSTNWKQIFLLLNKYKYILLIQVIFIVLLSLFTTYFDLSPDITRYDHYYDFNQNYAFPIAYYKQDYLMPFGAAKMFLFNLDLKNTYQHLLGSYSMSDRTPLVPLIISPFLTFFGDRLFIYQAVVILLISFLITVSFNISDKKISSLALGIIPLIFLNQYFLYLYHFVPVRLIALFFLLGYLNELFFKEKANLKLLVLYSLLAFLTHPVAIPYIFIPALYLMIKRKTFRRSLFLLIPAIAVLLWILWGISLGKPNPFLLSPISATTPSIGQSQVTTDLRTHLNNRYYNSLGLIKDNPNPHIPGVGLGFYRFTLIGVTSISGILLLTLSIITYKKYKRPLNFSELMFTIVLPTIFIVFVSQASYSRRGLVDNLFPVVYIFLLMGLNFISFLPPIILFFGVLLFAMENIYLSIKLDLVPMTPYFADNHILSTHNLILNSIYLCYILFIAVILIYAFKSKQKQTA